MPSSSSPESSAERKPTSCALGELPGELEELEGDAVSSAADLVVAPASEEQSLGLSLTLGLTALGVAAIPRAHPRAAKTMSGIVAAQVGLLPPAGLVTRRAHEPLQCAWRGVATTGLAAKTGAAVPANLDILTASTSSTA